MSECLITDPQINEAKLIILNGGTKNLQSEKEILTPHSLSNCLNNKQQQKTHVANTVHLLDLTDMCRRLYSTTAKCTFFSLLMCICQDRAFTGPRKMPIHLKKLKYREYIL